MHPIDVRDLLGNPGTRVFHAQHDTRSPGFRADRQRSSCWHRIPRVGEEVQQDLFKLMRICLYARESCVKLDPNLDVMITQLLFDKKQGVFDYLIDMDRDVLSRRLAGKHAQVIDDAHHAVGAFENLVNVVQ